MRKLLNSLNWRNLEAGAEAARPAVGLDLVYFHGEGFKEAVRASEVGAFLFAEFCAELLDGWARSKHGFDLTAFEVGREVFEEAKSTVFARETVAFESNSVLANPQGGLK